jgi:hypothetical protein
MFHIAMQKARQFNLNPLAFLKKAVPHNLLSTNREGRQMRQENLNEFWQAYPL